MLLKVKVNAKVKMIYFIFVATEHEYIEILRTYLKMAYFRAFHWSLDGNCNIEMH